LIFCPQFGQGNLGVNLTSSSLTRALHSGQTVLREYVAGQTTNNSIKIFYELSEATKLLVDEIEAVEALCFHNLQQASTTEPQLIQQESVGNQQNSTRFNKQWNLVRDQGVGGSNPLSPTNLFI
jgi:hypothetical protein